MTSDLASSPAAGYVPVGQKPEAVVHAMKVRLCGALRCQSWALPLLVGTAEHRKLIHRQDIGNQHLYHDE